MSRILDRVLLLALLIVLAGLAAHLLSLTVRAASMAAMTSIMDAMEIVSRIRT
jgi:hypothetical protein